MEDGFFFLLPDYSSNTKCFVWSGHGGAQWLNAGNEGVMDTARGTNECPSL